MDSLKSEENEQLQSESAMSLVCLLRICCDRSTDSENIVSPVPKIVKNLITYLCSDRNFTPEVTPIDSSDANSSKEAKQSGILSLDNMQKFAEKMSFKRSNSVNSSKKAKTDVLPAVDGDNVSPNVVDHNDKQNEVLRRGASLALTEIAKYFGPQIPSMVPNLWEQITQIMSYSELSKNSGLSLDDAKCLIQCLQVLEIIGPHLDRELHSYLKSLLNYLCLCLESPFITIRHMSARCIGMLSQVIKTDTMDTVLSTILELLEMSESDTRRQGAIEALLCVIDSLGFNIVPYIVLLIVPMLGRMSDHNDCVRLLATHCFAQLVQLMPLDSDSKANSHNLINGQLLQRKETERHFLEQLMNMKKLDDYKIPIAVKAELRTYQQNGVNWLAFLNKYKLHGIVADEMGLGKTLQTICILASDHYYQTIRVNKSSVDCKPLPSIVICPPTLTGHWLYEVDKFVSTDQLCPLHYTGPPNERMKLRKKIKRSDNKLVYNVVIASYDIVRNDIEFFSSIHWNYCVLDEGHVIKNGKTKLSKAIKSLPANHRLILTGTPIQNNVLELWSLFDFLMPGFLGTERQFMARYSRPILQSRDAKSSSKEQEAGVLAMESLHRQVLPFILRRMKEDVLKDLPPKIMQDYYCELSPLQFKLYEDFAKSKARHNLQESVVTKNATNNEKTNVSSTHIFQALQYLRKVCNHPKLVLTTAHPQYDAITSQLKQEKSSLSDISHAAKLCALRQLLLDCGIGTQSAVSVINGSEPVVNQHRALVFCQLKSMLDIVENDLFKAHMPSITYLRLDGNIAPISRHSVVHLGISSSTEDVLKDLPPKIMQDYYCELSPLQFKLYEDFAKSKARHNLQESVVTKNATNNEKTNVSSTHIFQALQYLRKVCNHPKLVLTTAHPQYDAITSQLKQEKSSLSDISHAAKLCALRQLLLDCGIGTQSAVSVINGSEPVVNQHRALVFCQLKSMLDIVENDLFKAHMPSITYLRLDGNIAPISRHSVVHQFNNDPSIDVLLLTTQVGGLGLNLTGADTVIFVEHDWNPMKDLQAMDRAHRIGQKKVVNVYRLITTGTLEEKIMGLQKFKLTIANTVISSDNSNLQTMATDQLLDLFSLGHHKSESMNKSNESSGSGMKNILENLPELWDSRQYDSEYDLTNFINSLKS
ncbi:unnamed protein product [Oppiella nova]|uniref:TATA-binding protein-associated factor 172 n=1 Tax=Oppiella nova TaxID=334625 RepID=A0A7R9LM53_9ACAR|nr:unnamed protein product [Oppiella nova]CAG2164916.1 unnamed protein product [Oppiella nova]